MSSARRRNSKKKKIGKNRNKAICKQAFSILRQAYDSLPATKGCMDNIHKPKAEGGCNAWCCRLMNPSLLYVEFLYFWKDVLDNWSKEALVDLIERAICNYLSPVVTKGCILFDPDTNLCTSHLHRPYSCRTYGITPEEEFRPKIERLRVLYKDDPTAQFRDQCDLIETKNGEKVTKESLDKVWNQVVSAEQAIGIDKEHIHDAEGGTNRTYHDHILLQVCPDSIMKKLQFLRLHGSVGDRALAVRGIINGFRKTLGAKHEQAHQGAD